MTVVKCYFVVNSLINSGSLEQFFLFISHIDQTVIIGQNAGFQLFCFLLPFCSQTCVFNLKPAAVDSSRQALSYLQVLRATSVDTLTYLCFCARGSNKNRHAQCKHFLLMVPCFVNISVAFVIYLDMF